MNDTGNVPKETLYTPSQHREVMARTGMTCAFTRGQSMRPLIWQGRHYVAVAPLVGEPLVGEMLLFEQQGAAGTIVVLHRLVGMDGDSYVTRGDNCLACEHIVRQQIIGRAIHIYRKGPARWFMAIKKKDISIDDPRYKRYVRRILRFWPLRRCCLRLRAAASRVYRLVFKRHER